MEKHTEVLDKLFEELHDLLNEMDNREEFEEESGKVLNEFITNYFKVCDKYGKDKEQALTVIIHTLLDFLVMEDLS